MASTSLRYSRSFAPLLLAVSAAVICSSASAQELSPRAYWPTPNGTNVLALVYQYSSGDVVTDPSLPVAGVDSEIDVYLMSYQRTFSLWDRTTSMLVNVPYSEGSTDGFFEGMPVQRNVAGLADVRARFAINLKGAPSMDGAGFQALRRNPRTIVGASLLVQIPTGEYEDDKIINLGTNRWSLKPAVGIIVPLRPTLLFEAEVGVWFFGDNDEFLGETRKQEEILSTEFHLIKRIRPGFWASLDANFYLGGRTSIGGREKKNLQRNSRLGATLTFPVKGRHALRASISTGAVTETGGDFEVVSFTYAYAW